MAFHLSGNDANDREVPGLSSSDESEDEDEVPAHWILGDYPWGKDKCAQKNFRQQVLRWCRIPRGYRDQAFLSMKRLLLAPFLFQHALIPQKWIRWANQAGMIKYDASNQTLPEVEISRQHYLAVRMIEVALVKLKDLSHKNKAAVAIVKMMYDIKDRTCSELATVIKDTKFDDRVKCITNAINDGMREIVTGDGPTGKEDLDYVASPDRCVLAALLCFRQFAETLCIITCEGRDFAQEMDWQYGEETFEGLSEKLDIIRGQGNSLYQGGNYKNAYDMYSIAIRMSPFFHVLYSNRCQASIKMGNHMAAFCDAYRAVVLNPAWAKAYYKIMTCLKKMGFVKDALQWGRVGLAKSNESDEAFKNLDALYKKYAGIAPGTSKSISKTEGTENPPTPSGSDNTKKTKKKKKKKATTGAKEKEKEKEKDIETEDVPPLVDDEGEWEDMDGDELKTKSKPVNDSQNAPKTKRKANGKAKQTKNGPTVETAPAQKTPEIKTGEQNEEEKKRAQEEEKRKNEEKKRREEEDRKKKEREEKLKEQKLTKDNVSESRRNEKQEKILRQIEGEKKIEQREKKEEEREHRKREGEEKKVAEKTLKEIQTEYEQFALKGSKALVESQFTSAAKSYSWAIELLHEKKTIRGVDEDDHAILLYARGMASYRQMHPTQVDVSIKFFSQIINRFKTFSHIRMVYYRLGKATYILNNFDTAMEFVTKAIRFSEKYPLRGKLAWPSTSVTIPESDEKYLGEKMRFLLRQCMIPTTPDAICKYEMCSHEHRRKQIYLTDLDFEGYFTIICDWHCSLVFHLKCWAKCKHDGLKLKSDREVLGINCFTPDCKGKIVSIKQLDAAGSEKNSKDLNPDPKLPPVNTTTSKQNKYDRRMQKSHVNLMRYKLAQGEKKRKKKHYRNRDATKIDEIKVSKNKEKQTNQNENIPADQDISAATVYMKKNGENLEERIRGVKTKTRKTNRRLGPISFQNFCSTLPSYRQDMSMHEIVEAIEMAKENGTPFSLPDDLRELIEEFEATLGGETPTPGRLFDDDERMKVPFLFEYFQDFFKTNGRMKIRDELFTGQILLLPEDMVNIITKAGGLVSFLASSPLFSVDHPYIGIQSQHTVLDLEQQQPDRSVSSRSSSIDLDFLGMSQFAKEVYMVGTAEDVDLAGLTGGSDLSPPLSGPNGFGKSEPLNTNSRSSVYSLNSETSSMHSLEDDMKTEAGGGIVNIDLDKLVFKRPLTPNKKGKNLQLNGMAATTANNLNGTEPQKKHHNQNKKMSPPSACDVSTQTEGKDEVEKSREAMERLQERLVTMEDNMTKLKRTSQTKEEFLQKQLQEAREAERLALEAAERAKQEAETEVNKLAQQRKKWQDKLQAAKEKEKESRQREEQAKTELSNLGSGMQEDRENHLQQILVLQRTEEEQKAIIASSLTRATKSEIDLVKAKEMFVIRGHMHVKAESERIAKEFDMELSRRGFVLPEWAAQQMRAGRQQWVNNALACQKTIETLKAAYASIVSQINNGRPLSELPPVPELKLPPPGPSLRQVMMNIHFTHQRGMGPTGDGDASNGTPGVYRNNVPPPQHFVPNPHPVPFNHPSVPPPDQDSMRAMGELKNQKKKNFQQLIHKLSRSIPELSKEQLEHYSQRVRAENSGLTGLLYDEIEERIRAMATRNFNQHNGQAAANPVTSPVQQYNKVPPAAPWASLTAPSTSGQSPKEETDSFDIDDEDSVCPICCDPLKDGQIHTLDCDHKFHYDCISKWMQKQRTCPNCRKFMADTADFPPLSVLPPGLARDTA